MDDEVSPESGTQDKPEPALDLNFVPTWARTPPENPYAGREDFRERDRGRDSRGGGRDRRGGGMGRRDGGRDHRGGGMGRREGSDRRGGRGERGPRPGGGGGRPEGRGRNGEDRFSRTGTRGPREAGRRPPREPRPRLDVKISFLPDRERLTLVVRDIQASRRAFPLVEIANRFLGREDLYLVKLEFPAAAEGAERRIFVQCLECKRAFLSRANAEAHVVNDHLDKFFTAEETEVEAPAGNFTCVARCGLSHTLLGPPNHHGYNEKIQELWASRFAHMSKAEYLGHIETVRDEALVEAWKESVRKKTVYRLKEVPEGEEAQPMDRAAAQEWMRGKVKSMLRESPRCMLPGTQSRKFDDGALRGAVSSAWQKESRFPLTLLLALRPAFRHMHLHLFKVNAKETYVTAIAPSPVDTAAAPEIVKEILAYLEANPGVPRQQVLEALRPGSDPESSGAAELLLHLGNLVANGGVIEFFNATLALPRGGATKPESAGEEASAETGEETPGDEPAEVTSTSEAASESEGAAEPVAEETSGEAAAVPESAPVAGEEAAEAVSEAEATAEAAVATAAPEAAQEPESPEAAAVTAPEPELEREKAE